MKRVHGIEVLKCRFGGTRKATSCLTDPEKIREGLERPGLSGEAPKIAKARRPAQEEIFDRTPDRDGVEPPPPDDAA
jgi:hypothetical protein